MEVQVSEPCQSENHNIISFSEPKPSSMDIQQEKGLKENEDQKKILQLDLSLSSKDSSSYDDHDHGHPDHDHDHDDDDSSKPELNLLNRFDMNSSSENSSESSHGNNNNINNELLEHRTFSCNYCQRKFYSSQALGGHQNAHKRERTLARRGYKSGSVSSSSSLDFGHRFNTTMASLPCYSNNRTLGIQVHSMIHKPSFQSPFFGFSSPNGWKRQQNHLALESQPAIGKLFHVGPETESSLACGIPRLGKFPTVAQGFGGFWFGGSSSNNNSGVTNLKSKQEKLQKLDLSLKL